MSTRSKKMKCFLGVECSQRIRLTTSLPSVRRLSRQCRILNISQYYVPPRSVKGIAFTLKKSSCPSHHWDLQIQHHILSIISITFINDVGRGTFIPSLSYKTEYFVILLMSYNLWLCQVSFN
jgi:hypothetical protein